MRRYVKNIENFLKLVPNEVYKKSLNKIPDNKDAKTLARFFVELAKKDHELATNIIIAFIKKKKQEAAEGKISPQTVPNHKKPILALLDSNGVLMPWKQINKILPRRESVAQDRAYTKEELQKMIKVSHDLTDIVIVTMFSSGGFRLDAWNSFVWGDYVPFVAKDGSYKGGALRIYRGDQEEHWTFLTPEACKYLELYKEQWKVDIGRYPKPDEPLLKATKFPTIHGLNSYAIKKRVRNMARAIGLRPPLPPGKRRHEVQLDHGFRKYFATMMRRAKVNYLDKEDMMGHKVGLEKHYERYLEEDFERFPEYQKAISFLTISEEEKLRYENQQKQKDLDDIEKHSIRIEELEKKLDDFTNGPKPRKSYFVEARLGTSNPISQARLMILQLWYEMRATESEKRAIWKKITEAKQNGTKIDTSVFGEPNFTLSNLPISGI